LQKDSNTNFTNPVDIANKFNEYFVNMGPQLAKKIPKVNDISYEVGLGGLPFFFRFYFQTVFFGLAFTKTGKPSLRNCLLSSPETRS
jgi:phenylalanine-4-hydroxylase